MATNSALTLFVRTFVVVFMLAVEVANFLHTERTRYTFSNFGYCLSLAMETWIWVQTVFRPGKKFPRAFWALSQICWTANIIILIIFWGYLYRHTTFQSEIQKMPGYVHLEKVLIHLIPTASVLAEVKIRGIRYHPDDFVWTIGYFLCYGVISLVQVFVYGVVMYPMLTWRDWKSAAFIGMDLAFAYGLHCIGKVASLCLHPETGMEAAVETGEKTKRE